MRSIQELKTLYRSLGRSVTPQRLCVWKILENNPKHPTAESIYAEARKEIESISLKTVYQILHELEDLGEITSVEVGTGALRYDPNVGKKHHHLVCTQCKLVKDVYYSSPSLNLPEGITEGFEIKEAEVIFKGLCKECAKLQHRKEMVGDLA